MAQTVKNLPTMQETGVQSLGQEDTLEKKMTTHYNFVAWEIPWTEDTKTVCNNGETRVKMKWMAIPP